MAEARCQIEDLRDELADVHERLADADARIDQLHAEKRSLQGRLIQATTKVEELEFANRLLEARLQALIEHSLSTAEATEDTLPRDRKAALHLADA